MAYCVPPSGQGTVCLFSKSAAENLPTGSTVIGFDTNNSVNSPIITNQYTLVGDNSTFVVNTSGIYTVEGNISVSANGATWAVLQKTFGVQLTRGATSNILIGSVTANQTSTNNYSFHVNFTFPFLVGDQIQFVHTGTVTSGTPTALGLASGFDLNTWCVFTFVRSI